MEVDVLGGDAHAVSRGPATVTAWEPPHRFACRYADDTGFSNTLSYDLSAPGGAPTRLRMTIHWVHEGESRRRLGHPR
ncbi:hypothetical protein OH809_39350 [Streptomyces sp. NBC_00873]|uniref:hypothetical protein n=1 Tax=unclassified Streptomyces TaxID=2593676 RepID=UPI003869564A|nr:hypothetical protein OH809_39350 [Streptomyces sp. NBC_00873]WTA41971.1 hypothetical protein OH821_04345 [Streptomyces sp. NBC_00842]